MPKEVTCLSKWIPLFVASPLPPKPSLTAAKGDQKWHCLIRKHSISYPTYLPVYSVHSSAGCCTPGMEVGHGEECRVETLVKFVSASSRDWVTTGIPWDASRHTSRSATMSMVGVAAGIIFHITGGRRIRMLSQQVSRTRRDPVCFFISLEVGLLGPSSLQATCMQLRKDGYTGIS